MFLDILTLTLAVMILHGHTDLCVQILHWAQLANSAGAYMSYVDAFMCLEGDFFLLYVRLFDVNHLRNPISTELIMSVVHSQ